MLVQYSNGRRAQVIGAIDSQAVPGVVNYYQVRHPLSGKRGWWNAANVQVIGD
jgi:hypothetical protein